MSKASALIISFVICPYLYQKRKKKDSPMSFGDTFKVLFWKILNIC